MAWSSRAYLAYVAIGCAACGRIGFDPTAGEISGAAGISFGAPGDDRISRPGVDAAGNLYLGGIYRAPLVLGGQTYPLTGNSGIYVVSFTPDLSLRWVRTYAATASFEGSRLVVGADGTSYFGGHFGGQLVLPDRTRDADPGQNLIVLAHDADGAFQWARDYGGDWNFQTHAIALDPAEDGVTIGGLYLTTQPVDVGTTQLPISLYDDAVMVRLDRAGTPTWATRMHSSNGARVSALRARGDGALCRGGTFEVELDVDDDGAIDVTALGGVDAFVGVHDAAGTHVWTQTLRSAGADTTYDALAVGDDCVFAARADGAVELGAGAVGALVVRYHPDGSRAWSRALGGQSTPLTLATALDGSILVGGLFSGTWQPDPTQPALTSAGGPDGFVIQLGSDGSVQRIRVISGPGSERVAGIHADADGLLLSGVFDATLVTEDGVLVAAGDEDVFVLRVR